MQNNVVKLPIAQVQVLTLGQYTSSLTLGQLAEMPRAVIFSEVRRLDKLIEALQVEVTLDRGLHLTSLEHVLELAEQRRVVCTSLIISSAKS